MASAQWQGRWYLVVLVMAGTVLSLIDRNLLGLMVESIKSDLQLSDTQMGLLLGPAFVIFYLLFGFPFGWLSDRFDRRLVIAAGIIIWSLATGAAAFAATFALFFAARSMVGAGEAALTPAGMSMMGDSFSRDRLPVAISIYSLSFHLGGAGAFLVGGTILKVFAGG
ncbi:MAG: MFS transporter, partial [Pseudomonadota bacterium]